jgi:hypothetical protein
MLDKEALNSHIRTATAAALDEVTHPYRLTMSAAARALEQACVQDLLWRWLDVEKRRAAFSVAAREQPITLQLAGLTLNGKIDRVDSLADGATILIDYKTGLARRAGWFPEPRLADPQLPAYATALPTPPDAIAFARLRPDDLAFEGVAATELGIAGVTPVSGGRGIFKNVESWPQLLADWRGHLEALARDFANGNALVAPRQASVCVHCHLHALCRIHERAPLADLPDAEPADD